MRGQDYGPDGTCWQGSLLTAESAYYRLVPRRSDVMLRPRLRGVEDGAEIQIGVTDHNEGRET